MSVKNCHQARAKKKSASSTHNIGLYFGLAVLLVILQGAMAVPFPSTSSGWQDRQELSHTGGFEETGQHFSSLSRDKWIGLGLAISSSLAIGTSFIITKKGLMDAAERGNGLASDGHSYLQNPIWWAGMSTMIVGEVANFAAYTFAPPILVTPLGALSVLIGAILASFILKEELGRLGKVGCTLCLVGTVIIVVNAPEDKEIKTVDEMLNYALQPCEFSFARKPTGTIFLEAHTEIKRPSSAAFMTYCLFVTGFAIFMIWRMVPKYGKRTPLVYISICSLVGSISVMSVKGFGVALKLTLDGNNQFTHPSTYCFVIVVVVCILVQMNYFNKALDQFSTNIVNPIYYVMFTASTIFASFLLFRGFNTAGSAAISLLGGFIVIFVGVYLLNLNRLIDPVTQQPRVSLVTGEGLAGTGRLSEHHERLLNGDGYHVNHSRYSPVTGRENLNRYPPGRRSEGRHGREGSNGSILFNAYNHEDHVVLQDFNELEDQEDYDEPLTSPRSTTPRTQHKKQNSKSEYPRISHSNDAAHQLLDNDTTSEGQITSAWR